jgi:hypothetical protein
MPIAPCMYKYDREIVAKPRALDDDGSMISDWEG